MTGRPPRMRAAPVRYDALLASYVIVKSLRLSTEVTCILPSAPMLMVVTDTTLPSRLSSFLIAVVADLLDRGRRARRIALDGRVRVGPSSFAS